MSSDDDSVDNVSSDNDDASASSSYTTSSGGSSNSSQSTQSKKPGDVDDGGGDETTNINKEDDNNNNQLAADLAFDFDEVQRRREKLIASREKISIMRTILSEGLSPNSADKMKASITSGDGEANGGRNGVNNSNVTTKRAKKKKIRRNVVIARPKNPNEIKSTKPVDSNTAYSFFKFNNTNNAMKDNKDGGDKSDDDDDMIYEDANLNNLQPVEVGKRKISVWPYDDYHIIQNEYYKTIRQLKMDELQDEYIIRQQILQKMNKVTKRNRRKLILSNAAKNKKKSKKIIINRDDDNEKIDDDAIDSQQVGGQIISTTKLTQQQRTKSLDDCLIEHKQQYSFAGESATIPVFTRQQDPQDLSRQVQGLNLDLFEEVAMERTVSIINTWMFDVGLIDELLTNGGATNMNAVQQNNNNSINDDDDDDENDDASTTKRNRRRSSRYKINRGKGRSSNGHNDSDDEDDEDDIDNDDENDINSKDGNKKNSGQQSDLLNNQHDDITKMDKEIAKLRNATKRQLAIVNARLKDGVIAIGSEVEALVNAVIVTKDDIGRLRDVSSYVYNNGDQGSIDQGGGTSQQFMLTKYPKLKQAINARRNLTRVFRELEFFSHIPITCDRLREEMHAGEWTDYEWSSLRSVAREHVDLEIFLVEAEAGMKRRMEEEEAELQAQLNAKNRRKGDRKNQGYNTPQSLPNSNSYALIDRFLEKHVENVWEMGEEISIRIMNGIGTAYELAMVNPAGLVALVEAVEIYEAANDDYKTVHGEDANKRNYKLKFTDMRAIALAGIYRDFENKCKDVFNELLAQATDIAKEGDDEEASNKQFSAILRAANELGSDIVQVKERMAPCVPENWAITTLFTTCVAHICSKNILHQIGGTDGQNLPDLSLKQLLDLVAWVETFRATIYEIFPILSKVTASIRSYEDNAPKLLMEDSKTIDVALAEDSLVWVNNTLWDIHNMAKDEFLFKTKEMAEVWLERGYSAEREVTQSSDGKYRTAFCEDVYSMTSVHLRTIRERLTRQSEALVQAVIVVFHILQQKQTQCRDNFCYDFQSCCAAANDFLRMSDLCDDMIDEIKNECTLSSKAAEILDEKSAALLGLYSSDAVHASKKTQIFCIQVIEEDVTEDLFSTLWEEELTENEIATAMVRTLDDCMEDLERGLDELMVSRAAEAQISAAVNVYIKCLLVKGSKHTDGKKSMFNNNEEAVQRMRDDAGLLRSYFNEVAEDIPTLKHIINDEFSFLDIIFDLLSIAAGLLTGDVKDFITKLHKRLKDTTMTKFVVGDLWHIVNPAEEKAIYDTLDEMEEALNTMDQSETSTKSATERSAVPGLQIENVIGQYIEADSRKRPFRTGAAKRAETALRAWTFMGGGQKKEEPAETDAGKKDTDDEEDEDDEEESDGEEE